MPFTQIACSIKGAEGPLVTRDGRVFVVEPEASTILEIGPCGEKTVFATTGGIPAGLQLHRDGSIYVADMQLGILRVDRAGAVYGVVTEHDGHLMRGCNDCYFDSTGNLYFTAPAGSSKNAATGEVFCLLAGGQVIQIDGGYAFSNGIAVSSDDRLLIVAETFTRRLFGYRLDGAGRVTEKFLFATLPGEHFGGPDGIEFDAEGNLVATNWGGGHLEVFSPAGDLLRRVTLPFEKPSNLHFEGPGSRLLLISEHTTGGLWRTEWSCCGQVQFGWR